MSIPEVRIDQGRLTLNGVIWGASAILLNPLDATTISLVVAIGTGRGRGTWRLTGNTVIFALSNCLGAVVASYIRTNGSASVGGRFAVIAVVAVANIILAATALGLQANESPLRVLRQNVTSSFAAAFVYFGLATILISYVLDGSLLGYFLATIVCVLALALTDTIAGRRVRTVLESELTDADRHLFHSRAVEGVVHNLRNHVATAHAYLKEIEPNKLDDIDRDNLETATDATNDAVTVLRSLSQGATPKVSFSLTPVDLNELAGRALGMARARARTKEVQLGMREYSGDVKVRADPLLMREVLTNLINNAVEAAPVGGRVDISTGRRTNGWPYASISDNGPGVSDDHRHHLFEPHFTTKESGTGLGLFMSYGIVREHQGDLTYSGSHRGAVFTVALPPFDR